jgi:hypothetical protein
MFAMLASLALAAAPAAPVEVMVLGSYHMNNPGRDLHNVRSDDVTRPERQRELEAVAEALAAFSPTKIMVERQSDAPDLSLPTYRSFTPADLATKKGEEVQIGFRLARKLGHVRVYGIDEQPGPGEPDYFPFGKVQAYAQAHGMAERLRALHATAREAVEQVNAAQASQSIGGVLAIVNRGSGGHEAYYELLKIGGTVDQPGADLNAGWYLRNAKIFAKLMTQAEPGDRILVIYGFGHNYWLRHFAATTPGYRNVDPVPFLEKTMR